MKAKIPTKPKSSGRVTDSHISKSKPRCRSKSKQPPSEKQSEYDVESMCSKKSLKSSKSNKSLKSVKSTKSILKIKNCKSEMPLSKNHRKDKESLELFLKKENKQI
mgnify:CR=1 FL=1